MQLSVKEKSSVCIVSISGRLNIYQTPTLQQTFRKLTHESKVRVIIDAEELTSIDSSGLGTILMAYKDLRSKGGILAFAKLSNNVKRMLSFSGLIRQFSIFDNLDEGVMQLSA